MIHRTMSHSYCQNYIHTVYSTSGRQNLIRPEIEKQLYAFTASIAHRHGIRLVSAGGMANHMHILFALPPTRSLASAVNLFKTNSSRFLHEQKVPFDWQEGYGAFSVSLSQLNKTIAYIKRQPEHHKKMTFEEEFRFLLEKSNISYDDGYVLG